MPSNEEEFNQPEAFDIQELKSRFKERSDRAAAARTPTIDTILKAFAQDFANGGFGVSFIGDRHIEITAQNGACIDVRDNKNGTFCVNHDHDETFNEQSITETTDELADFHGKHKTSAPTPQRHVPRAASRQAPQVSTANYSQWGDH